VHDLDNEEGSFLVVLVRRRPATPVDTLVVAVPAPVQIELVTESVLRFRVPAVAFPVQDVGAGGPQVAPVPLALGVDPHLEFEVRVFPEFPAHSQAVGLPALGTERAGQDEWPALDGQAALPRRQLLRVADDDLPSVGKAIVEEIDEGQGIALRQAVTVGVLAVEVTLLVLLGVDGRIGVVAIVPVTIPDTVSVAVLVCGVRLGR